MELSFDTYLMIRFWLSCSRKDQVFIGRLNFQNAAQLYLDSSLLDYDKVSTALDRVSSFSIEP